MHREDLALVAEEPARERGPQDRHEVAHRRDRLAVRLPVPAAHVAARLHTEPEQQPPTRELVERGRLQRHRHGRARPNADDTGAESDPFRLLRRGRGRTERVRERDLRKPAASKTRRLRPLRVLDRNSGRQRREKQTQTVVVHR